MAITTMPDYRIDNGKIGEYIVSSDVGTGSAYTAITYSYYTTASNIVNNTVNQYIYTDNIHGTDGGNSTYTYKIIDRSVITYQPATYYYYSNISNISDIFSVADKKFLFKSKLQQNFMDTRVIKVPRGTPQEEKARELLREMVTSREFKEYLIKGRLTVIGKTNLRYVIRPGHQMVEVFAKDKNGKYRIVERLCLVLKDHNIPPTDSVIMRKLMIEHDEFAFRSLANVYKVADHSEFDQNQIAGLVRQVA